MQYIDTEDMQDKEFVEYFESRFKQTIEEFDMFDKSEKLTVAASGGKDSTVVLYLLKKFGYDIEALTINAHIGCYSDESLENLKKFCKVENIKLHEVSLQKEFGYKLCHIMAIMEEKGFNKTSCSICGTLRRYLLNKYGKKLNAKILVTGHNLDDEADGMMMYLFSGNPKSLARINPVASSQTFLKRVKPLYFTFEEDVERYSKIQNFEVHYGWCPCSVKASRRFFSELEISPRKKFNLTKNVIVNNPKLKVLFKGKTKLTTCKVCDEPASNEVCQSCTILSAIKDPEVKKLNVSETIKRIENQNTCEKPIQIK